MIAFFLLATIPWMITKFIMSTVLHVSMFHSIVLSCTIVFYSICIASYAILM